MLADRRPRVIVLRPWRLAAQIYGLSLLTLLIAAVAVYVLAWASRTPQTMPRIFDHFVHEVAAHARDPVALQAAADRLADRLGDEVALYTWDSTRWPVASQALLRAQRELLANVSHELRTPLTRLRVGLDLVAEADAAGVQEELAGLGDDLAALDRLVADVLSVASLDLAALRESAASPLRSEPTDLVHLCRHAAARFAGAAPRHRLRVTAPPRLLLDGDPTLLRRVVDNLLENARKYSEVGTAIDLELVGDGVHAVLTVRDQGIGIDGADLPHIFTPFFRADRSRARTTGGVGLGLTLAQRIVVAQRGAAGCSC
jgi:two-component system OmpR family sensor kinase